MRAQAQTTPMPASRLSPRELQIIERRRHGATYKEIASDLHISPNTLKSHLGRAFRKLNVRSSLECCSIVFA